jgi:starch synthase
MRRPGLKICLIASEMIPYAKTGGLADVMGALPRALAARGHDVRVILPRHACIDPAEHNLRVLMPELWVNFPGRHLQGKIYQARYAHPEDKGEVTVYFFDCPELFDRAGLYGENGTDYPDNAERFACFNMAIVWLLKALNWAPDILHCNDWQAAFLPVFLRAQVKFRYDKFFSRTRILFTIHNLAYQGLCDFSLLERVGLSPSLFQAERMEYWGWLNPMKGGIYFSDWVSTVSPRYAEEILTQEFGCGLEGFLGNRADRITGILNGVDTTEWDPQADPLIAASYSADDLSGKVVCKRHLQERLKLPVESEIPILAMVNRLDAQKGIPLLIESLPKLMALGVQFVFLGSGRPDYQAAIIQAAKRYRKAMRAQFEFDNDLAHAIEAGADAFLMLSRYEPCGLNQMFSLHYGTVPIVHRTGGLVDTIHPATPTSLKKGEATGFFFTPYTVDSLLMTVRRALDLYHNQPAVWRQVQERGMREDFSWNRAAESYEQLYQRLLVLSPLFVPNGL